MTDTDFVPVERPRDRQPPAIVPPQPSATRSASVAPVRSPRSPSTKSLPRRRSQQTPAEAQEGYRTRMAAKQYAAKKKAAKEAKAEVINITVDDKGVKIDKDASVPLGAQPMSMPARRPSRNRVGRSNSRARNGSVAARSEDKENMTGSNQKTDAAQVDAFFNRKRGSVDPRSSGKDLPEAIAPSWDGSMPRRHSSRSFIHQKAASNAAVPNKGNTFAVLASVDDDLAVLRETRDLDAPRRQRRNDVAVRDKEAQRVRREPVSKSGNISTLEQMLKVTLDDRSANSSPIPAPTVSSDVQVVEVDVDAGSVGVPKQVASEGVVRPIASDDAAVAQKSGWCEECAGVGQDIADLLSELEKQRDLAESRPEPSIASGVMRGWKSYVAQTVLGESKSKGCAEKARLQQEVEVLQATVAFLHKKIDALESYRAGS